MRRWTVGVLAVVGAMLVWAFWPAAAPVVTETAREVDPVPAPRRVAIAAPAPADDAAGEEPLDEAAELVAAAKGELGVAILNRVCALCEAGLDDPACAHCPKVPGPYGRITLDVVGEDGRPLDDFEGSISASCRPRVGVGGSGDLDLPAGPCVLAAIRVDGLLTVIGDSVEVQIDENGAHYASISVPTEPWGAAGVDLAAGDDGRPVVRRLIPGTAIGDAVPIGATLLAVDGDPLDGLSAREAARVLNGPVGSAVELTFRDPESGETVTVEVERSRLSNEHVAPDMVPG
jgi:hypothetical protein